MANFQPTAEQRAVIDHDGSHAMVSAVAGAGKTSTLVERIAQLVKRGADPRRILPIQYNVSAKDAMQRKLQERMGTATEVPQARTFHSIGYSMLKRLVELGAIAPGKFQSSTTVHEDLKRRSIRRAWKEANGGESYPSQDQLDGFNQFVTLAKANICSPEQVFRDAAFPVDCLPFLQALAHMDAEALQRRIFFFDDMLKLTWATLEQDPSLWSQFRFYHHVLVDEFQDANAVQYALLDGIVGDQAQCMAIGDPDQTLYSWRGSKPELLTTQFAQDYAPCATYTMQRTFRYGHATALLANHIITLNQNRHDKIVVANNANADTRVRLAPQDPKTCSSLAGLLDQPSRDGTLGQHAMLVRFYSQSVPYEIELVAAGIPYFVYGRAPLLLVPEIGALVSALSFAADYWVVDESLRVRMVAAMLSVPTLYAPREVLEGARGVIANAFQANTSVAKALHALAATNLVRDDRLADRLRRRADVIGLLEAGGLREKSPVHVLDTYLRFTDFDATQLRAAAAKSQVVEAEQNINALKLLAARYPTLTEFLDTLGPLAGHEEDVPPEGPHLAIMSCHRAKGAEWPHVYLPGWAAGQFPRQGDDPEEERRIAYVAVTRAINELVILHPRDSTLSAMHADLTRLPDRGEPVSASRFLYDAEVSLSVQVAEAARTGAELQLDCRRADVVERYVTEAKIEGIRVAVPEHLARKLSQTDQNPNLSVTEGSFLRSGEKLYQVTQKLGARYYYVRCLSGGDPRLMSLDEPGWSLA